MKRSLGTFAITAAFVLASSQRNTASAQTAIGFYFSDLVFGGGYQTTLTYINYSSQSVTCTTNFFADSGAALPIPFAQGKISTRTDTLPSGGSVHDQTTANLSVVVTEGWAEGSCSGPVQASLLYRLYESGTAVGEASVNAESAPASDFVTFAETETGVAYANPSATQSATVTFTAFNEAGAQLASTSFVLAPLAHAATNVGPMLGLASFTGSLEITSTIPIISLALNAEAFPAFSSLPPGDLAVLPTGSQMYYFSDLAFAGGFQTTLTYINYGAHPVTCTTNFFADSGAPLSIPFMQGTMSTRVDVLPPGGSIHVQTTANPSAVVTEGWAEASCTEPVQASLLYRLYQSGTAVGEASVTAETAPTTEFVTFAQTATGVAYANPSTTQSASVTFAVFSAGGTPLGSKVITLSPLAHSSANIGPLLGLSSFTGFVEITSTIPIVSLSLNAEAFPVFSSLPPGSMEPTVTLNAPSPGATLLSGHAYNVDPATTKVVIYVLTNQWYVQPFADAPFTNIANDGSWQSSTNPWQAIVVLLVNPSSYTPAATEITNPALDPGVLAWTSYPAAPASVNFSGRTWGIKMTGNVSSDQFDPGPNYWSSDPSVVNVQADGLHLKIAMINGNWQCGEVYLTRSLGYGTYTVQIDSRLDQLNVNTVAAPLFIYAAVGQELDNEYSGLGGLIPVPDNAQFVVQPYNVPGNLIAYLQPPARQFTSQIEWRADHVTFRAWNGWASAPASGDIIYQWTYTGTYIPPPGQERVHVNLWLLNGHAPTNGVGDEIVINAFAFQP